MILKLDHTKKYFFTDDEKILIAFEKIKLNIHERVEKNNFFFPIILFPMFCRKLKDLGIKFSVSRELFNHAQEFSDEKKLILRLQREEIAPESKEAILGGVKSLIKLSLRGYQEQGVVYGFYTKRFVLGDDVGLGKTVQVISIFLSAVQNGHARKCLIVTPASTIYNFAKDISKFYPDIPFHILRGTAKERVQIGKKFFSVDSGIMLVNYEGFRTSFPILKQLNFDFIACDEAHRLKGIINISNIAKQTENFFKCLKIWNPNYRIYMTATPIENSLFDLYPGLMFLDLENLVGQSRFFHSNFVRYEKRVFKKKIGKRVKTIIEKKPIGFKNENLLKSLIRHIVLRRTKEECQSELPPYTQINKFLELPGSQMKHYKSLIKTSNKKLITAMRFLNNPHYFGEEYKKLPQLKLQQLYEDISMNIDGKVLVFVAFRKDTEFVSEYLESRGIKCMTLTGQTKVEKSDFIEMFRKSKSRVLVATNCINYGMNLQFCKGVINFCLPFNPSILEQRIGRVHRQGQTAKVIVINYIFKNTYEERLYQTLESRKELVEEVYKKIHKVNRNKNFNEKKLMETLEVEFKNSF